MEHKMSYFMFYQSWYDYITPALQHAQLPKILKWKTSGSIQRGEIQQVIHN